LFEKLFDRLIGAKMWEFNWSVFWAFTAALFVRGIFRLIKRLVLVAVNEGSPNATLQDIWERLL
jgi:hypothetical protein